jgi:hypothetical protein
LSYSASHPIALSVDRASVLARLPARGARVADGMGAIDPASVIALAQTALQFISFSNPAKERYKQVKPQMMQAASQLGPNPAAVSGTPLSPQAVATALSFYLKEKGVNLTPTQLLAMPSSTGPAHGPGGDYMPLYLLAAALGLIYVMRR